MARRTSTAGPSTQSRCDPVLTDAALYTLDPRTAGIDRDRIATISVFHAAVGNWDWSLDVPHQTGEKPRLWNTDVIVVPKPAPGTPSSRSSRSLKASRWMTQAGPMRAHLDAFYAAF